jgi:transcriptional regulator with XRE-family HTH domain
MAFYKQKPGAMHNKVVFEIGERIRALRQEQKMNLQVLGDRAGVTKGLISRIENGRTIPSLPVLINLIHALGAEVPVFFKDIGKNGGDEQVLIIRNNALQPQVREDAQGFTYFPIIREQMGELAISVVLLRLDPGSERERVVTDGYEFKYILEGACTYEIGDQTYELYTGDSIYFNARLPHVPINRGETPCTLLVVYFLQQNN